MNERVECVCAVHDDEKWENYDDCCSTQISRPAARVCY